MKQFKLKYFLLSLLSGMLIALSFQKFNLFCFAWVAFIPLLYSISKSNIKFSFIYGFTTGFFCYAISMFWMFVFLNNNLDSYFASFVVSLLLCIYLSSYFSLWTLLLALVKKYFKDEYRYTIEKDLPGKNRYLFIFKNLWIKNIKSNQHILERLVTFYEKNFDNTFINYNFDFFC